MTTLIYHHTSVVNGGSVLDRSGEVVNAQIFSSSASIAISFVLGQFVGTNAKRCSMHNYDVSAAIFEIPCDWFY